MKMLYHNRFLRDANQLGNAATTFSIGKWISGELSFQ
jgi:hypothetical protein